MTRKCEFAGVVRTNEPSSVEIIRRLVTFVDSAPEFGALREVSLYDGGIHPSRLVRSVSTDDQRLLDKLLGHLEFDLRSSLIVELRATVGRYVQSLGQQCQDYGATLHIAGPDRSWMSTAGLDEFNFFYDAGPENLFADPELYERNRTRLFGELRGIISSLPIEKLRHSYSGGGFANDSFIYFASRERLLDELACLKSCFADLPSDQMLSDTVDRERWCHEKLGPGEVFYSSSFPRGDLKPLEEYLLQTHFDPN